MLCRHLLKSPTLLQLIIFRSAHSRNFKTSSLHCLKVFLSASVLWSHFGMAIFGYAPGQHSPSAAHLWLCSWIHIHSSRASTDSSNCWTSAQVGSYALRISQNVWTTFLQSSLSPSICCCHNTKSLQLKGTEIVLKVRCGSRRGLDTVCSLFSCSSVLC